MKLYATVTSERASKGQGGNEYINIKLCDKEKMQFAEFHIWELPDGICIAYDIDEDVAYLEKDINGRVTKGKQQKGEACANGSIKCGLLGAHKNCWISE
jgi:hypothetical protein